MARTVKRLLSGRKSKDPQSESRSSGRFSPADEALHTQRIDYGDGTDIVATDELGVLVGLVGLKMGLEPRGRPLIVNHWATWCDGCVRELPDLAVLRRDTKSLADFVAVGWEGFSGPGSPSDWIERVDSISREHGVDWSTMVFEGTPDELFEGLSVSKTTIPQTWVLDSSGRIVLQVHSELTLADIEAIKAKIEELK